MKKVLALVLAVVMVCTMAMAATTGTKTTTTVDAKGYTQYATNGEGVFVKETSPIKTITKVTHGNDVANDGTTTYYADLYKVEKESGTYYFFACAKADATHKLVNGSTVIYLSHDATANDDSTRTTTLVVDKFVAGASKPACGDYVGAEGKGIDVYMVGNKAYATEGNNWAVLNGQFVQVGDEVTTTVSHNFKAANITYKAVDAAGHMVPVSIKCPDCGKTFNVVKSLDKDFTGSYIKGVDTGLTELDGYIVVLTNTTNTNTNTPGTTTNPGTGANDVVGVAAALAVVALVSGAAISLKK